MKKIFILFSLIANQLSGTNTDSVYTYKKWEVGISVSPEYSYRTLKPIKTDNAATTIFNRSCSDSLNSIEKPSLSWTLGIPVTYHFSKFISVRTGLYFSNKTFKSKGFVQTNGAYLDWQIFKSDNWQKDPFIFIEIPAALQFTYRPEKQEKMNFSVFVGATICSNITEHYYNSRRWETDPGYQHPELEDSYTKLYIDKFKLLYFGYTVGLKMNYKLNSKFMIGLEPVFKFYGKEFVSTSAYGMFWSNNKVPRQIMGITEQPYSYGINLTLEFTK